MLHGNNDIFTDDLANESNDFANPQDPKSESKKSDDASTKKQDKKSDDSKQDDHAKDDHSKKDDHAKDDHSKKDDHAKDDHSKDNKQDHKDDKHGDKDHADDDHSKDDHSKKDDHGDDAHGDDGHGDDAHHDDHGDGHGGEHHGSSFFHEPDMTLGEKLSEGMKSQLDTGHLFDHVKDAESLHLPFHTHLDIPKTGMQEVKVGDYVVFRGQPTKFMALELLAAIIVVGLFTTLATKIRGGKQAKGRFWNLLEVFVVYVRDEIAKPAIGEKDTNRFLPFLLTTFFFILCLNLLGMIPQLGSATGSLAVTSVLAISVMCVVVGSGMKKMGVVGFLKAQVPSMDLPPLLAVILIPMIWVIEIFGLFVKHFVLAVRLFANMFAGHLVLAVLVAFIGVTVGTALFYAVAPIAGLATVAFSILELFVAFLQAYVFTFLAALFIGSAQHAH